MLFGKVPDVRRRLKAQNLSADDLRLLTDMEQEGENRKTMLKLLGQLPVVWRRTQRSNCPSNFSLHGLVLLHSEYCVDNLIHVFGMLIVTSNS